jgi:hypothetical protein
MPRSMGSVILNGWGGVAEIREGKETVWVLE